MLANIQNLAARVLHDISLRRPQKGRSAALTPWGLAINAARHISLDGVDMVELAEEYGTPLLVVNRQQLVEDAGAIQGALQKHAPPGSQVLYSYKTNSVPGILKILHGLGIGAEVISPYELWLADRLKVPGGQIVYNGVDKTEESLARAADLNVLSVNIDHLEEIERIERIARDRKRRVGVGLRLALAKRSQFGLEIESGEALAAGQRIAALKDHLDFTCIHFNTTSNAKSSREHVRCALAALDFIARLKECTGLTTAWLDIGGGFGVPTSKNMSGLEYGLYRTLGAMPKAPGPDNCEPIGEFIAAILKAVRSRCRTLSLPLPKILVEPGRFITSRAEFLLARVLTIKSKAAGTCYAITDAGRLSTAFPCDFEYHEAFAAERPSAPAEAVYDIMGRICTSADWMFKNKYMPILKPGDILAVMDAGAYFSSYSTNFAFPRPAVVLVAEGTAAILRKAETFEHLTAMDSI